MRNFRKKAMWICSIAAMLAAGVVTAALLVGKGTERSNITGGGLLLSDGRMGHRAAEPAEQFWTDAGQRYVRQEEAEVPAMSAEASTETVDEGETAGTGEEVLEAETETVTGESSAGREPEQQSPAAHTGNPEPIGQEAAADTAIPAEASEMPEDAPAPDVPETPKNLCPYALWSWIDFGGGVVGFYYPISSSVNNVNGAWDAQFETMLYQAQERGYLFQSVADAGVFDDTGSIRVDKYKIP